MNTIGNIIDQMTALRDKKRELTSQADEIGGKIALLEAELIKAMENQGITKSTGTRASASISESVKPSVEDWDAFYAFIHRYKYYHLLDRRPSVLGCREMFELKGKIPGVVPYVRRGINLRSI